MITFNEYKTHRQLAEYIIAYDVDIDEFCENVLTLVEEYGEELLNEQVWDVAAERGAQALGAGAGIAKKIGGGIGGLFRRGAKSLGRAARAGAERVADVGRAGAQRVADVGRGIGAGVQAGAQRVADVGRGIGAGVQAGAQRARDIAGQAAGAVGGAIGSGAEALGQAGKEGAQAQALSQVVNRLGGLKRGMETLGMDKAKASLVIGQIAQYIRKTTGQDIDVSQVLAG